MQIHSLGMTIFNTKLHLNDFRVIIHFMLKSIKAKKAFILLLFEEKFTENKQMIYVCTKQAIRLWNYNSDRAFDFVFFIRASFSI